VTLDYSVTLGVKYEKRIDEEGSYVVYDPSSKELKVFSGDILIELLENREEIQVICKLEEQVLCLSGPQSSLSVWRGDDGNYYVVAGGYDWSQIVGQYDFLEVSREFLRKKAFEALGIPGDEVDVKAGS
jgi:hypothetical protein